MKWLAAVLALALMAAPIPAETVTHDDKIIFERLQIAMVKLEVTLQQLDILIIRIEENNRQLKAALDLLNKHLSEELRQ